MGRRAPLGDPTIYRVRGADVAVRRDTAREIEVDPLDAVGRDVAGSAR
ncbi:MAG: FeoA domain-containing protein [Ilumatobacteraceae bacterium]